MAAQQPGGANRVPTEILMQTSHLVPQMPSLETTPGQVLDRWAFMIHQLITPNVVVLGSPSADRIRLRVSWPVSEWIQQQPKEDWCALESQCFDVSQHLATLTLLRWQETDTVLE